MLNSSLKLLITGANGQLGTMLQHLKPNDISLAAFPRHEMDITDVFAVETALTNVQPNFVVNTAAYTAVDQAESDQAAAKRINVEGAKNLAIFCERYQIPLIHLSTDYVFDGTQASPYQEESQINPINFYGTTKWLGEEAVRRNCEKYIILRTSGVFSEYGHNFVRTMLRLGKEKKALRIVADQITCPTYTADITRAIFQIARINQHWGTYHYCSKEPVSWYGFAHFILQTAQSSVIPAPITSKEYLTAAKRPAYSVLDCHKIQDAFGISQPDWRNAIHHIFKEMKNDLSAT